MKIKIMGWIASALSITGVIFNAYKIIWCWPIWIIANLFWAYLAFKRKDWAQLVLWIVFTLSNLYAWYIWSL
jgi:nicotinamide riboside transporter PnuC